jgi:predicted protein tyrosine phosphatase
LNSQINLSKFVIGGLSDVTVQRVRESDAIVSIISPGQMVPAAIEAAEKKRTWVLRFEDANHSMPTAPAAYHVKSIIDFAKFTTPSERVFVHCATGRSRSTAAMAIILATMHKEVRLRDVFGAVQALQAEAWPNARMIRFADRQLGLEGYFEAALEDFQKLQATLRPELAPKDFGVAKSDRGRDWKWGA